MYHYSVYNVKYSYAGQRPALLLMNQTVLRTSTWWCAESQKSFMEHAAWANMMIWAAPKIIMIWYNLFFLRLQSDRSWGSGTLPFLDMFSLVISFFLWTIHFQPQLPVANLQKNETCLSCLLLSQEVLFLDVALCIPFRFLFSYAAFKVYHSTRPSEVPMGHDGTGSMDRWIVMSTS